MNRRQFMLTTFGAGSLLLLPDWAKATNSRPLFLYDQVDIAPLEKLSAFRGSKEIEGDTPDEAHEIFWDKEGYIKKKGGIPKASANYDVIIVGGGMAGLAAAWNLKNKKVLVIEGNPRLGGNSKSQYYGKSYASQGAAYLAAYDQGDEFDKLYTELGIKNLIRNTNELEEPVFFKGKIINAFWEGRTDPEKAHEIKKAHELLKDVYENKLPELPVWDSSASMRRYVNGLDQISLTDWIKRELGEVHPHVMEHMTLYCWSSFGGSPDEISAAQGLYFYASDMSAGANVLPGGNGLLAEKMYQKMKARGNVTFRAPCFGADVRVVGNSVQVCFKNESGNLETVMSSKCIFAGPKKVAKFIVEGISKDQKKAMDWISYRAYLVANLFLKKKVKSPGYDLYSLVGQSAEDTKREITKRVMPDMIFADWAGKDKAEKSILTCYLPLPFDMAQQYIFIDHLYEKYEDRLKTAIAPHLAEIGLSWNDVEGMRLVRYGHSVPLARKGQIADGTFERANQDIDGKIFFANQDTWGNPCFETSYGVGLAAARKC